MPASLTNRELVLLLKQGDQTAFESLYHRYKYPIYIKLLKFVKAKVFAPRITLDNKDNIDELFERYLHNQCTAEEINRLLDYFKIQANQDSTDHLG